MMKSSPVLAGLALLLGSTLPLPAASETGSTAAAPTPRSPSEIRVYDFFRPPGINGILLNPAGTHIALAAYEEKVDSTGLRIINLEAKTMTGLRGSEDYDTMEFRWAGDDRILFTLRREKLYAYGLYLAEISKMDRPKCLNEYDVVQMLGSPVDNPTHYLVWPAKVAREEGKPGPVVDLDLTQRFEHGFDVDYRHVRHTLYPPDGTRIEHWFMDRTRRPRYALCYVKGHDRLYRLDEKNKWTPVDIDLDHVHPLAVDSDPSTLFVSRMNHDGQFELVRLNTKDGSTGPALHTDPKYDFSLGSIMYSSDEKEVLGLNYIRHAPEQVWLRPEEASIQRGLDASLPAGRFNLITSRSADGRRMIVLSASDRHPGAYYLYEADKHAVVFLANRAPWLPEKLLSPTRVTTYRARDGLAIDAYVTVPLDYEEGHPRPMVVLPHGGPWYRDLWGYNPEAQFFASRGYIVFQPNYRGSTGYNEDISLKHRFEFRRMHEDVTDGVHALIEAKIADPAHIAIIGASFGGYLAVCGAAFEPGLYKCAVTIAGVFDWARVMKEAKWGDPDTLRYDKLLHELGDPKVQQAKFEAMSPINAAGNIKIPVFVAHGEADRVADASQSHRLVRALKEAGIRCETMFVDDEGHGFAALKNRVELYERIESFLKKNL